MFRYLYFSICHLVGKKSYRLDPHITLMFVFKILLLFYFHRVASLGHFDLFEDYDDGSDDHYHDDSVKSEDDYYGELDFDYDYIGEKENDKDRSVFYGDDDFDEYDPDLDEMGNPIDSSNIALPWEFADDMSKIYREEL